MSGTEEALVPAAARPRTSACRAPTSLAPADAALPAGAAAADPVLDVEVDPAEVPVSTRSEKTAADRAHARGLFTELAALPEGDPRRARLRDELVEQHLPLVEYLARRFRNRGEPLDDLVQVATIGLIKSVDRFDLERGVEFSTYATPTIVGEIKRHFRDKGWAIRVPRRLQELKLSLTKATSELSQKNGRSPTVAELAGPPGPDRGGDPRGPRVGQRLLRGQPGRARRRRRRQPVGLRLARHHRRGARGRRVPRVAQAAAREAAGAREEDPAAALLRRHDPVADRRRARDQPDARLAAAGPHPGPAARGPARRGVARTARRVSPGAGRPRRTTPRAAGCASCESTATASRSTGTRGGPAPRPGRGTPPTTSRNSCVVIVGAQAQPRPAPSPRADGEQPRGHDERERALQHGADAGRSARPARRRPRTPTPSRPSATPSTATSSAGAAHRRGRRPGRRSAGCRHGEQASRG